ncbi:MAG: dipeptidase [Bifidobacteriaceae bacterium]|jgi:membrane dipeptidase|nr:dipeptidase [Bifidobacteriaceae bacterium]
MARGTVPDPRAAAATAAAALDIQGVIDGHNDLPAALRNSAGYRVDTFADNLPEFQTDLPRLRRGRVAAQFWSAWAPTSLGPDQAVTSTLEQIDAIHRLVAAHPAALAAARTAADVRAAARDGRIACLIGVEGGHSINRSPAVLRCFAKLGVRYMTLTHSDNTPWADSATDTPSVSGLTEEGRAIVREMERVGMLVDLSHVAPETMRAALAAAGAPVIFSHSSARAVTDHPRNVPDDVLAALAANGGVAQVTFVAEFVSQAAYEWFLAGQEHLTGLGIEFDPGAAWGPAPRAGETPAATMARAGLAAGGGPGPGNFAGPEFTRALAAWTQRHPRPRATLADVVAHIEHIREVAGIDHVGLGGDYDGAPYQPEGLGDVSGYPRLLEALALRGWSVRDLTALTGRNMLRVLAATDPAV